MGLGKLQLTREEFWRYTPVEFWLKYEMMFGRVQAPPTQAWLRKMMEKYPDEVKSGTDT